MTPKRFNFYIITWLLICLSSFMILNWSIYQVFRGHSPALPGNVPGAIPGASNSISIPKLNLSAPIVLPDSLEEKDINQALHQGVVSLTNKEKARIVLIGHSSVEPWQKGPYGQIFAQLDKLEPDDLIYVSLQGQQYSYQVKNLGANLPNTWEIRSQEAGLFLITCWPPGTTEKRLIVQAQ